MIDAVSSGVLISMARAYCDEGRRVPQELKTELNEIASSIALDVGIRNEALALIRRISERVQTDHSPSHRPWMKSKTRNRGERR